MNKRLMKTTLAMVWLAMAAGAEAGPGQICRSEEQTASGWKTGSDGTVTDTRAGLQWQRCPQGLSGAQCELGVVERFSAVQARELAIRVNRTGLAGHRDWRLPTARELRRLVSTRCLNPAIDLKRFPNTPSVEFWSGDFTGVEAAYVDFKDGHAGEDDENLPNPVRLVRSLRRTHRRT